MGHPTDIRGFPPTFWRVLEKVGEGETVKFSLPKTDEGRKRCWTLMMKFSAFRKRIREADPEEQPEFLITTAWATSIIRISKHEFHVKPQDTFEEEIARALQPLENDDDED